MDLKLIESQDNNIVKRHDTGVILHLYYPDMWNDMLSHLLNLGKQFDLFVTIPYEVDISENTIRANFPDAQIYRCENRGRDIAPFLVVFSAISKLDYKYLCKVHTKKSPHIASGIEWQQDMLQKLLGSQKIILQIKKAFDKHPNWGLIAPQGHVTPHNYFWELNAANVIKLAHSVGIPTDNIEFSFVAGSMFWFRPQAFDLLLKTGILTQDFDLEQEQQDGTLAHAFERFFGMAANYAGYKIAESNSKEVRLSDVSFQFRLLIQIFQMLITQLAEKEQAVQALSAHLAEKEQTMQALSTHVAEKEQTVQALTAQLSEIVNSKAWKIALLFRRIRVLLVPPNSRRILILRRLINFISAPFKKIKRNRTFKDDLALIRSSGLFDETWYLANNPDVAQAKVNPLFHYLRDGGLEGRDPGPNFNSARYLDTYDDVKQTGINPLVHYLKYGREEGRRPNLESNDLALIRSLRLFDKTQKPPIMQIWLPTEHSDQHLSLPESTTPLVSVVVVARNAENTHRCLAALANHDSQYEFEVVVADDSASDSIGNMLSLIDGIRLIRNDSQSGFAASCNLGATISRGQYLFFLRGDLVLQPECLNELVKTATTQKDFGMVGVKLVAPNGFLWEAGEIIQSDGHIEHLGAGNDPLRPSLNFFRSTNVSTSAIFVTKSLFEEVGGFDKTLDAYAEADLALTFREREQKNYYQPLACAAVFSQVTPNEDERNLFIHKWNKSFKPQSGPSRVKKVLYIDTFTPTPDKDAGSVDAFNHMSILTSLGFQVTFAPTANMEFVPKYTTDLQRIGVECLYLPYIPSLEEHIIQRGNDYGIVVLTRVNNAANFISYVRKYCRRAKIIFSTVDLHYLREIRQAEFEESNELMRQAQETRRIELDVIKRSDCTLVVSSKEKEILQVELPDVDNIVHFPLIVNINNRKEMPFNERKDIFFVGGFRHLPNVDAIHYFVTEVWPLIRNRVPGIKFYIIGSHAPKEILDMACEDIIVVGYKEDIAEYFNECRLSVAPIRFGAGLKGKVIHSLGFGLPVVASSIAAEGSGLINNADILIADDAQTFSDAVVRLYTDENLWRNISEKGLTTFNENYSLIAGRRNFIELIHTMNTKPLSHLLPIVEVNSFSDYQAYTKAMEAEYARRIQVEATLIGSNMGFTTSGYCYVCGERVNFFSDFSYALRDVAGRPTPNWRERMVCPKCGLNNRMRAAIQIFEQMCKPELDDSIYLTEQKTPLYKWFEQTYHIVVGSEYFGDQLPFGQANQSGLRNETLTHLTFTDNQFDYILTFDVFEHIPDYEAAFRECLRCLKPDGTLIFTVPFSRNSEKHIVRAQMSSNGEVLHILPPEYHGDPLNDKGVLCFYHFGWELLGQLRIMGFSLATAYLYWSDELGYLGQEQLLFIARKDKG